MIKRTIEYIEAVVCEGETIEPELLHERTRKQLIKDLRQMIMYLALKYGNTEHNTGSYFCLDHATAHHAKIAMQNMYDTDKLFKYKIDKYDELLKAGEEVKADKLVNLLSRLKRETNKLQEKLNTIMI